MNAKKFLPAAALALLVAGPAMAQVMTPSEYVMAAGASDLFERQSAMMVLQTTQDPKVQAFAREMIADHTKSTKMVTAAAKRSRLKVAPPMLMPAQAEMIAQLQAENGAARDALYIAQQKPSHNQALAVQQAYAQAGTAPALRMAAQKIQPVVESHIAMLKQM